MKAKQTGTAVIKAVLIILIILLLGLGCYAGYLILKGSGESGGDETEEHVVRNYVVYADPAVIPSADAAKVNSAASHDVKMNATWTFKDGAAYSKDAYVENPLSNINSVCFDVKVNGYDEPVFTSPELPVGSRLENITLDKVLKAGTYNCTLTYYLLSKDGSENVGTLQMALKIIINGNP
ncbi:MAG: hypothetical protein ILP22_04785 [Oscillospiraceae bacterium]|nr:hypothetical protein [Oscillospiraceae bacterium]